MCALPARIVIFLRLRAGLSAAVSGALRVRHCETAPHTALSPTMLQQPNLLPHAAFAISV